MVAIVSLQPLLMTTNHARKEPFKKNMTINQNIVKDFAGAVARFRRGNITKHSKKTPPYFLFENGKPLLTSYLANEMK